MKIKILLLVSTLFVIGCSKNTIVLADSGKEENAIIFSTNKGKIKLDQVGQFTHVGSANDKPADAKIMSKEEMHKRFEESLSALPKKAATFIIYLKNGDSEFEEKSEEKFNHAIKEIHSRIPCRIDVIGHTDTVGDEVRNQKISVERAKKITDMLIARGIPSNLITSKGYGENDLLVQTPNNTPEPKNRSVEIFIK